MFGVIKTHHARLYRRNRTPVGGTVNGVQQSKTASAYIGCVHHNVQHVAVMRLRQITYGGIGHNQPRTARIQFSKAVVCQPADTAFVADAQHGIIGKMVAVIDVADVYGNRCVR